MREGGESGTAKPFHVQFLNIPGFMESTVSNPGKFEVNNETLVIEFVTPETVP
jgi:hypothetical protein